MKIWIATGGTGGHVFPALSIAEELNKLGHNVVISLDNRVLSIVDRNKFNICLIWASGVGAKSKIKQVISLFKIFVSSLYLFFRFIIFRPKCIVGFGGYSSFPAVFAGRLLNIPTLLHEQNGFLGRANRFSIKFVNVLMTSFKNISGIPNNTKTNVIYTGLPVRQDFIKHSGKKISLNRKILITGGSQGAKILDDIVPHSLIGLKKIFVTHQTRPENVSKLRNFYIKNNISANVIPFIKDMASTIKDSDLIIGRSGASTVVELMTIGRPAILIPLNINKDQLENAKKFEQLGAGIIINQNDLNIKLLNSILEDLFSNNNRLLKMAEKAFVPNNAVNNILDEILKFA